MKVSEFRQLIREEVRKVLIEDQSSLPTLEDARPKGSYFSIIAIKDKVVGDSKDIIITKEIYFGEVTPKLLDSFVAWLKNKLKQKFGFIPPETTL